MELKRRVLAMRGYEEEEEMGSWNLLDSGQEALKWIQNYPDPKKVAKETFAPKEKVTRSTWIGGGKEFKETSARKSLPVAVGFHIPESPHNLGIIAKKTQV